MGKAYPDRIIMNRAMREAQMTSPSDFKAGYDSYDSGSKELDLALGPGLRAVGFQSLSDAAGWLETRNGRRPTGLEIAGQGKTFARLRMAGVATCLAIGEFLIEQPQTTPFPRRRFSRPPVTFVPGNIADDSTWENIRTVFQDHRIDPPNLILFTPAERGLSTMPKNAEFFESVVIKALSLARPGPVVMVGEMNSHFSVRLEQWLLAMQHRGEAQVAILAGYEYGLFALVRP